MTSTDLKAHLALLRDVASDALSALNEDEAHDATIDVSRIAQPREATFRFAFNGPVTTAGLRTVLVGISKKHHVDPGYVMMSWHDYEALKINERALTIIHLVNDHTGSNARVVVSPDIGVGEAIFGVLYAPLVTSVVDAEASTSEQTLLTMPS